MSSLKFSYLFVAGIVLAILIALPFSARGEVSPVQQVGPNMFCQTYDEEDLPKMLDFYLSRQGSQLLYVAKNKDGFDHKIVYRRVVEKDGDRRMVTYFHLFKDGVMCFKVLSVEKIVEEEA